jgi:phytoene dehydrogenase-like protein
MEVLWNRKFDAIVVGSGNGGLATATQLAQLGKKVLMLEKHNIVGGFSTSFVRGRFEFEASLHELCDMGSKENPGGIRQIFESLDVEVDWRRIDEAYRVIIPSEGLDASLPFGLDSYCDAVEHYVPGSRPFVEKFIQLCEEVTLTFDYIAKAKGVIDRKVLLNKFPNFVKTNAYSLDDVLNALKMPKKARDIISGYWCYIGLPTSRINFTLFAAMFYKFLITEAYIPKMRSTEFALALEARFRELGGVVELNTEVMKILVENGAIVGVETKAGERIAASQVFCCASPTQTFSKLIYPKEEVPKEALKWCNARTLASSGFVVWIGLNKSKEELGLHNYSYFIYETSDTDKLYRSFYDLDNPIVQATVCLNHVIPDCSPEGTTIMSFTILHRPEAWKHITPEQYFKKKNEIAMKLIDNFERATGIKIKENIEEIDISAAPTYAHYTNAYQGVIYGYETDSWDSVVPRILNRAEEKYINGLYFTSGWGVRTLGFSSALSCGIFEALQSTAATKQEQDSLIPEATVKGGR